MSHSFIDSNSYVALDTGRCRYAKGLCELSPKDLAARSELVGKPVVQSARRLEAQGSREEGPSLLRVWLGRLLGGVEA